jgi:hypothetical protein
MAAGALWVGRRGVQRPEYRAAKLRTLLDTIPEALGPTAAPPSLFWDGHAGAQSAVDP